MQVTNTGGPYYLVESSAVASDPFPMFSGSGSGQLINLFDNPRNNSVSIGNGLMLSDADSANSRVYVAGAEVRIINGTLVEQLFFDRTHPNISIVSQHTMCEN